MVRPNLRDVGVLRGVNEEAPPHACEPDEEDCCVQARRIGRVELSGCESAKEDHRGRDACCAYQQKSAAAEAIDV